MIHKLSEQESEIVSRNFIEIGRTLGDLDRAIMTPAVEAFLTTYSRRVAECDLADRLKAGAT